MVTHSHKQVKIEPVTHFHLRLHGSTGLEDLASSNNHSQVPGPQLVLRVRRVIVGIPRRLQDHADGQAGLEALLAKRKMLEVLHAVSFCRAVDRRVAQDDLPCGGERDGRFAGSAAAVAGRNGSVLLGVLEFPPVLGFVA